jgi:ubiquinone biosynthesis protein
MERVRGIPSDDIAALDAAGIDRHELAAKGVRVFYTQVFRDNFFHADAHAGNIWVDSDPPARQPALHRAGLRHHGAALDEDQYYLAENFMAIFNRDYRRIAELHVRAGWMPRTSASTSSKRPRRRCASRTSRARCREISLAEVLIKLFRTAQRYELTLQPQLILLQKTLLNIEGVGRLLDPKLDIWAVRAPVLRKILRERYSPAALAAEFRKRLPELVTHAPEMPRLLHAWLRSRSRGRPRAAPAIASHLIELISTIRSGRKKRTVAAIFGSDCWWSRAVVYGSRPAGRVVVVRPRRGLPESVACGRCWRVAASGDEISPDPPLQTQETVGPKRCLARSPCTAMLYSAVGRTSRPG